MTYMLSVIQYCKQMFRNKYNTIYGLDPANFLTAPGLAWQACLKETIVKLELLTNIVCY